MKMTFPEWLAMGVNAGWISQGVCAMHEGLPMTDEEEQEFEDGGDPCQPALRVWVEKTDFDSDGDPVFEETA